VHFSLVLIHSFRSRSHAAFVNRSGQYECLKRRTLNTCDERISFSLVTAVYPAFEQVCDIFCLELCWRPLWTRARPPVIYTRNTLRKRLQHQFLRKNNARSTIGNHSRQSECNHETFCTHVRALVDPSHSVSLPQ